MTKLTKRQLKAHQEACELLQKERLTDEDEEFVFANWHEGADADISRAGAFFTPLDLAFDFAIDTTGPRIIDLCAGIGALAYAVYHHGRNYDNRPQVTCIEINPHYVEV
ncbi:MAG: hypothetical protein AAGC95_07450 [Pseudomonadota bacterium]